jgi:hypothetical protein
VGATAGGGAPERPRPGGVKRGAGPKEQGSLW